MQNRAPHSLWCVWSRVSEVVACGEFQAPGHQRVSVRTALGTRSLGREKSFGRFTIQAQVTAGCGGAGGPFAVILKGHHLPECLGDREGASGLAAPLFLLSGDTECSPSKQAQGGCLLEMSSHSGACQQLLEADEATLVNPACRPCLLNMS